MTDCVVFLFSILRVWMNTEYFTRIIACLCNPSPRELEIIELFNHTDVVRYVFRSSDNNVLIYCRTAHSHPLSWWKNRWSSRVFISRALGLEDECIAYVEHSPII